MDHVTKCQKQCKSKRACVWFLFSPDKRCKLLTARLEANTEARYISGPPSCTEDNPETPLIPPQDANCIETDVEYAGFNILNYLNSLDSIQKSKEKCQEACSNNLECKWFNFQNSSGECYLKYYKGYKQYVKGMHSGPPSCSKQDPDLAENELKTLCIETGAFTGYRKYKIDPSLDSGVNSYHLEADTVQKCQALCNQEPNCVWFNFNADKYCWLLSTRSGSEKQRILGTWTGPPSCQKREGPFPTLTVEGCFFKDVALVGFSTPVNSSISIKSLQDCKNICKETQGCDFFNYIKETCYLTKHTECPEYIPGAVSGSPTC